MIMRTDVNCACVNCNAGIVASCDATYAVDVPNTHTFVWIHHTSVLQVYRLETHANGWEWNIPHVLCMRYIQMANHTLTAKGTWRAQRSLDPASKKIKRQRAVNQR